MKLRTFSFCVFIVLFCLAIVNLALGYLLTDAEKKISSLRAQIAEISAISDDLVLSSQFSTRFARAYVIAPDSNRRTYYDKISDILEGKIARPKNYSFEYWDIVAGGSVPAPSNVQDGALPISDRMRKTDATPEELGKVTAALELFKKLSVTERTAMHAVDGEYDDGSGNFTRKAKADPEMAKKLLFGNAYLKDNADLSLILSDLKVSVTKRFSDLIARQQFYVDQLLLSSLYLGAALFAVILVSVLFLRHRFAARAARMMSMIRHISAGDFQSSARLDGNDEIAEMSAAIDQMRQNLVETVRVASRLANDVASGSAQLQHAATTVSSGANDQASSVVETAAAMEQIAVSIRQNAEASRITRQTSTRLADDAKACAEAMGRTAAAMKNISDRSVSVGEITRKIELLALNASVEAARAGEHGKGFAVVAAEVSKLAEMSREAAISIQQSSVQGKDTAENTNRMLLDLLPEIEKAKDLVEGIAIASEEQSTGAQQVNVAVRRLDEVTQKNAAAAAEMSETVDALTDHARELKNALGWFHGARHATAPDETSQSLPPSKRNIPEYSRSEQSNLGKY